MPVQAEAETNGFRFDCYLLFAIAINKICCSPQWLDVSFTRVHTHTFTSRTLQELDGGNVEAPTFADAQRIVCERCGDVEKWLEL